MFKKASLLSLIFTLLFSIGILPTTFAHAANDQTETIIIEDRAVRYPSLQNTGYGISVGSLARPSLPTTSPLSIKINVSRTSSTSTGTGTKVHGNVANNSPATLYKKVDADGSFQKWGVTKHEDPTKRYTKKEINGGRVIPIERGPRREMLKKERELVETNPGPQNREPWAGKRSDSQKNN